MVETHKLTDEQKKILERMHSRVDYIITSPNDAMKLTINTRSSTNTCNGGAMNGNDTLFTIGSSIRSKYAIMLPKLSKMN